jgi:hypothetical protein
MKQTPGKPSVGVFLNTQTSTKQPQLWRKEASPASLQQVKGDGKEANAWPSRSSWRIIASHTRPQDNSVSAHFLHEQLEGVRVVDQ